MSSSPERSRRGQRSEEVSAVGVDVDVDVVLVSLSCSSFLFSEWWVPARILFQRQQADGKRRASLLSNHTRQKATDEVL